MRQALHNVPDRAARSLLRSRAPLLIAVLGTASGLAISRPAHAQVGSANVPLPNVMLLLDTSGSFEYMIDGTNPEDAVNNAGAFYANCELATQHGVAALPNRWGLAVQALTGSVLNAQGTPYYSCVTMDRASGPPPTVAGVVPQIAAATTTHANGLDIQYGIRDEAGNFFYPYDSGYYLPYHRPASVTSAGLCVYSPNELPGAVSGGVGLSGGAPLSTDCPNESGPCQATDFPPHAIGTYLYDTLPSLPGQMGIPITGALPTPNLGYSSRTQSCIFSQGTNGILDQASTLIRFGLMTFDNDPSPDVGVYSNSGSLQPMQYTTVPAHNSVWPSPGGPQSPFSGMWSYDGNWLSECVTPSTPTITPSAPWSTPSTGLPANCTTGPQWFELGARNPAAPPWEGRLIGFPNAEADTNAVGQSNLNVQHAIQSMRPFGATPTAGLMTDAEYYFWGDPTGPGLKNPIPDPYVQGGCRPQYIILLTDGSPNEDLRPSCQGAGVPPGVCPYQLPEDTASVLATGTSDLQTGLSGTKVFTYVIGFAVSGNISGNPTPANCAALEANGTLAATCSLANPQNYSGNDTSTSLLAGIQPGTIAGVQAETLQTGTPESPCCSLQRIAVAGGTQHAYFADTPGDLNAALAAIIGDITGQLGSRTIPVASPTVSYPATGPSTSSFLSTFSAASCPAGFATPNGGCSVPWQSVNAWTGDIQRQDYTCPAMVPPAPTPLPGDDFAADLASQPLRNFMFFNGWNSNLGTSTNSMTLRPYLPAHIVSNVTEVAAVPADNLDNFSGGSGQTGQEISNFAGVTGGPVTGLYMAFNPTLAVALNIQPNSCQAPAAVQACTVNADCASLLCSSNVCTALPASEAVDVNSCANLALSYAMAQSIFTAGGSLGDTALSKAYTHGVGLTGPTNRSTTPLGAILDSTPAIIAPPSASVRDDSYLAFATALSRSTLLAAGAPRDTMLYVATIDGLLHAFDTSAGIPPATGPTVLTTQAEAWSFVPPAVLPNLLSNYPGAGQILLDGAPVVKDVIFARCDGANCPMTSSQWVSTWHTMLVAGFGLGGRGYYALDVTDPRPPTGPQTPLFGGANYPTSVLSTTSPPSLSGTGPHFQWQITSVNLSGTSEATIAGPNFIPNQLFGKISGTPAIATVYADPTLPTPGGAVAPQELGIAILPGGSDGLPTQGLVCPREAAANPNTTFYNTHALLYQNGGLSIQALPAASPYNVSDAAFPPREAVRGWASACTGPGSAVAGRSLMIVSVATGQVLQVFVRAPPANLSTPSAWDVPTDGHGAALIGNGSITNNPFLNFAPLDSPMTGRPVVYPTGVGVVASAIYIGDADGTMWRFDISDPNPRNWTGAIFADAYSPAADIAGGDSYPLGGTTDWNALDSQPVSIEPQLALNTTAQVTLDFMTGDQSAFDPCYSTTGTKGTNGNTGGACLLPLQPVVTFLYSVKEVHPTQSGMGVQPYTASVNWYKEWTTGERVTGPMAIFNGALYFATYVPTTGNTAGCMDGGANLYAWDFANVSTSACGGATGDSGTPVGCGGITTIDPNFAPSGEINYVTIASQNVGANITQSTVIPGVSVATASCATASALPGGDTVSGASHTTITSPTPPTYSLTANIGKGKNSSTQNLIKTTLTSPTAPTVVDSWATLAE